MFFWGHSVHAILCNQLKAVAPSSYQLTARGAVLLA